MGKIVIESGKVSTRRTGRERRGDALARAKARTMSAARPKGGFPVWPLFVAVLWIAVALVAVFVVRNRREAKASIEEARRMDAQAEGDWVAPREAALGGKTFAEYELTQREKNEIYKARQDRIRQHESGRSSR